MPERDAERRRLTRRGRRLSARRTAEAPGTARREALESADRAADLGLVHEEALQRQLAEALIPDELAWAFVPSGDD